MLVGTLGNPNSLSTCSYVATTAYFPNVEIKLYETFELASIALKEQEIDRMVVPAAYPSINPIIMDENLKCVDVFLYDIPNLVLAVRKDCNSSSFKNLYLHPATLSLVDRIDEGFIINHKCNVTSNTEAAYQVSLSIDNICITNQLCVEEYNLDIKQIIKPSFAMPFIVFQRKA